MNPTCNSDHRVKDAVCWRLLDCLPQKVFLKGRDLRYLAVNKALAEAYRLPPEAFVGKSDDDLWPGEKADRYREADRKVLETGEPLEEDDVSSGRTVRTYKVPVRAPNGKILGVLGVFWDISDLKKTEIRLHDSNARLQGVNDELTLVCHIMSHDFQAYIRQISSFSDLLTDSLGDRMTEKQAKYIYRIKEAASTLKDKLQTLLDYSRAGQRERLKMSCADSNRALVGAMRALQCQIDGAGASITVDCMPTVTADEMKLTEVFQNLISNAIKFRRPGSKPEIHVSSAKVGGSIEMYVEDNGIGVRPEDYDRIFQIFQVSACGDIHGNGVGLSICRRILEAHGGGIRVEKSPSGGSRFILSLPA